MSSLCHGLRSLGSGQALLQGSSGARRRVNLKAQKPVPQSRVMGSEGKEKFFMRVLAKAEKRPSARQNRNFTGKERETESGRDAARYWVFSDWAMLAAKKFCSLASRQSQPRIVPA